MTDYAARRAVMVDTQIRPSDVTKFPIIDAMMSVPREAFVPVELREAAYMGENIDLGGGRVILDPRILGKMLDALDIQADELVLDVGCALGYSSAVMARVAEAVVAVEENAEMAGEAPGLLSENGADNVILQEGPLTQGAPEHGPYDVIVVEGAVEHLPQTLCDQVKEGGRIACLFMEGALGAVRIGYRIDGEISWRFAFNAGAPVLPGFERHAAFAL
ncbi:protein-L-isoaspartate(D-aspartate) O-methyltransferase [Roseovarius halotolerans]|uniref:Protein-L-isoaspartate O-methyltransferase n=1 Tax=Roseovarius halotolerans TaxID=505353 RepID=A0A1X6Y6X8_9RHOB|nr:methyltransferase domain-containing protein [Roseovarius halotolerans]RKT35189.1 protein-L-isoaspartate(D-aspartate) O-methyltransferase [Roseovarius halotolerans]SLN12518.1 Protein-L-isoaspartate O-methyltransferase [Roseovarius halotolerans]